MEEGQSRNNGKKANDETGGTSEEGVDDGESRQMDEEEVIECEQDFMFEGKEYGMLREQDLVGKYFKDVNDAQKFYEKYAFAVGFSIRKDALKHTRGDIVQRRGWVCSNEGKRRRRVNDGVVVENKRKPPAETRVGCQASFVVTYCPKNNSYIVRIFKWEHNHELAKGIHKAYLRSHRVVSNGALAQAMSMQSATIRTCHSYEYMVDQAGGYANVGFTVKDLYNKIAAAKRKLMVDGDAEAALMYFNAKAAMDPELFCKFRVDEENRMATLFWRDSQALTDYMCFGDVLMFDSTYKTNLYGMPLVIFVGMNNHRLNCVFGFAFVTDEKTETYRWVLRTFLEAMKGKKPVSVITDGDEAMRGAIEVELKGCKHRICSWHLCNNMTHNKKNSALTVAFSDLVYRPYRPEVFEHEWQVLLDTFSLNGDEYMRHLYNRRERWAEAYIRGHFMGGSTSTQRCESMNRCMKDYLHNSFSKLVECIPQLDRSILRVRNNSNFADFRDMNSFPVLTTALHELEKHAATIYTESVFCRVRKQITEVLALNQTPPVLVDGKKCYEIVKYRRNSRKWLVWHEFGEVDRLSCSCRLYESEGIPCAHMFCVMKWEGMKEIPGCVIMKRWTKEARVGLGVEFANAEFPNRGLQSARYAALTAGSNIICSYGSESNEAYNFVKQEFAKLTIKAKSMRKESEGEGMQSSGAHGTIIQDPKVVPSQGKHKYDSNDSGSNKSKRHRCGVCGNFGHNRTTCHERKGNGTAVNSQELPEYMAQQALGVSSSCYGRVSCGSKGVSQTFSINKNDGMTNDFGLSGDVETVDSLDSLDDLFY